MASFKDNNGRTWSVVVTVDTVKRVKNLLDVNLAEAGNSNLLQKLAADPVLLVDTLYVVVKPDADAAAITDEQFGRALAGDAVGQACDALMDAIVDFFPNPRREVLRRALDKMRRLEATTAEKLGQMIEDPRIDAAIDKTFSNLLSNLEASAASIPGP